MSETPDQRELRFEELLRESARAAAEYDESEEEVDHGAAQERSERQALRRVKGFLHSYKISLRQSIESSNSSELYLSAFGLRDRLKAQKILSPNLKLWQKRPDLKF